MSRASDAARPTAPEGKRNRLRTIGPRNGGRIESIGKRSRAFLALMRFGLPAIAVALLLLVVVWPLVTGNRAGFRLSFMDASSVDSGPLRMVNARYMGLDEKNQAYTVTADTAIQETADADLVELVNPKADITLDDDGWLALTSERGLYSRGQEVLDLAGAVNAFADSGFEMRTETARIELTQGVAEGHDPVEGQGPMGVLHAQGFRILERGARIEFEGPVKLTIYPAAKSGA